MEFVGGDRLSGEIIMRQDRRDFFESKSPILDAANIWWLVLEIITGKCGRKQQEECSSLGPKTMSE